MAAASEVGGDGKSSHGEQLEAARHFAGAKSG